FQPLATMPAGLQLHIRYPQDLFNLQATTYATYHVLNPSVFYINEDAWSIPTEQLSPTAPLTTVSPYYVMMRLPGQASVEYLQIMPFTAYQKQNMISWLAVRNDGPSYGQLVAYQLPKDQNILGPGQIANQIQSNPDVSASFTLLNSNGSRVIEGNLLVVPIGNTFLYFEPIYLTAQSSQTALPLLKKVIVADASNVEYSDTLAQALQALTNSAGTTPTPTSPTQPSPTTSTLVQLVNDALTHANQAQTDLTNGDLGGYASENAKEAADVKQIQQLIAASPGPTTPATPATSPTAKP
ncbi:MAG TPA: UPF0182 family protein, partial [Candidatus Dormibacteraeota bacterium]|nr:UPF0182 family protein [Candidatus Dormibacteraeota bacterium]